MISELPLLKATVKQISCFSNLSTKLARHLRWSKSTTKLQQLKALKSAFTAKRKCYIKECNEYLACDVSIYTLLKESQQDAHLQPNQNARKKMFSSDVYRNSFNKYALPLRTLIKLIWNLCQRWVKQSIFKFLQLEITKRVLLEVVMWNYVDPQ
jgi:hypothetical protein